MLPGQPECNPPKRETTGGWARPSPCPAARGPAFGDTTRRRQSLRQALQALLNWRSAQGCTCRSRPLPCTALPSLSSKQGQANQAALLSSPSLAPRPHLQVPVLVAVILLLAAALNVAAEGEVQGRQPAGDRPGLRRALYAGWCPACCHPTSQQLLRSSGMQASGLGRSGCLLAATDPPWRQHQDPHRPPPCTTVHSGANPELPPHLAGPAPSREMSTPLRPGTQRALPPRSLAHPPTQEPSAPFHPGAQRTQRTPPPRSPAHPAHTPAQEPSAPQRDPQEGHPVEAVPAHGCTNGRKRGRRLFILLLLLLAACPVAASAAAAAAGGRGRRSGARAAAVGLARSCGCVLLRLQLGLQGALLQGGAV